MRKALTIMLIVMLLCGLCGLGGLAAPVRAGGNEPVDATASGTAAYVLGAVKNPTVGTIGGEWAIIGLARSGYDAPDSYYGLYYDNIVGIVTAHGGVIHENKLTEYSRVVIALTAAGYDPRDVAGYDFTGPLEDFDNVVRQGVVGPIFALLAIDCDNYANNRRLEYVAEILRRQRGDGGWSLAANTDGDSDPDMTAMALQALAKYRDMPEVATATDKALDCLSALQNDNAGYTSGGYETAESAAQVLIALCELGIGIEDPRFRKNGNTLLDNILGFKNADGSFKHIHNGKGGQMPTEQALLALASLKRWNDGANSLYRMDDAAKRDGRAQDGDVYGKSGEGGARNARKSSARQRHAGWLRFGPRHKYAGR